MWALLAVGVSIISLAVAAIYKWVVKGTLTDTLALLAVFLGAVTLLVAILALYQTNGPVADD